jgi:SAM-dependent methyltransferase
MKKYASELTGKLLDFGCGCKPYQSLFVNISEYIGIDIEDRGHDHKNEHVDFYYNGETLPFKDETFESILSNEVLEHVPNLHAILDELNRVLKPGGKILFTVPFVCFEHELPYDFRRFTIQGLINTLKEHNFKILMAEKTGNFIEVVIQLWISYLRELLFTKNKFVNIIINILFISPFTLAGLFLSLIFPSKKGLYFDCVVVGIKTTT